MKGKILVSNKEFVYEEKAQKGALFEILLRPLNIPCQSNSDRRNPITPELKF
jgi:hypothetical protein